MRLILTLLARNEIDVVSANLTFHFGAGVDFVIATDNASDDGTTEILESHARQGRLHLIREEGRIVRNGAWVTRMARLAASEFDADWVIHGDADEFYWPRGGDLKEVLATLPTRYGVVRTFVRTFLLLPDDERTFHERMTTRLAAQAPINDPTSIFRPGAKLIHRADPAVVVSDGTHGLSDTSLRLLPGWHPIELLHFPFRTRDQAERKFRTAAQAWLRHPTREPPHYYASAHSAIRDGRLDEFLDSLTIDDGTLARGLKDGSLVVDVRLRDALRALHRVGDDGYPASADEMRLELPGPDLRDNTAYAVDAAILDEADVARLQRRMDEVEARLGMMERRSWQRLLVRGRR